MSAAFHKKYNPGPEDFCSFMKEYDSDWYFALEVELLYAPLWPLSKKGQLDALHPRDEKAKKLLQKAYANMGQTMYPDGPMLQRMVEESIEIGRREDEWLEAHRDD